MPQRPSPHPADPPPAGGPHDDDYAAGYADGLAQDPARVPAVAGALDEAERFAAAEERYRHGYWQGRHDRKHHRLELHDEDHGRRYYLDGRPVHNGDQVEVRLEDGQWRRLRLEGLPAEILGYGLLPALAGGYELVAKVPLKALLRWPAVS